MTPKLRTSLALSAVLGTVFSALPAFAGSPAAPEIAFYSGYQPITDLVVGRDLEVALLDGSPDTLYDVTLRDEWGNAIATLQLLTSAWGSTGRTLLWSATGIVGCDPWAPPLDPSEYYFASLDDAELHLPGRTFEVVVTYGLSQLANEDLDLVADPSGPVPYLSDPLVADCARHIYFEWEELHMSFAHVDANVYTWVYVVPHQTVWADGHPMIDVTTDGVEFFELQPGQTPRNLGQILPVHGPGYYDVIVRFGLDQSPFFDEDTDQIPGRKLPSMDSRTFKPCTGYCPL